MKAIISHDIDHISILEHTFKDAIIPKFVVRMHLELLSGKISIREYMLRWTDFFKNKWQNIDELITFNNINKIPSSFFIAVNSGPGLNYSNRAALAWIEQMKLRNCEVNLHGIQFQELSSIKCERDLFQSLSKSEVAGVRLHYVRHSDISAIALDKAGYRFDSTEYAIKNPYKIGHMWEFPVQIIDSNIIENGKKMQSLNLKKAKESTLKIIDQAVEQNLKYLGIDFHDRYFSHSFTTWLNWYIWLVEYLKSNKVEFVNFEQAILKLESAK